MTREMSTGITDEQLATEFESDSDAVRLCVATCPGCGATVFPRQPTCPRCLRDDMRPDTIEGPGEVWSWTVQRFPPGAPYAGPVGETFEPFSVGYVRFGDRLMVEGRLVGSPASFDIGRPMDVVTERIPGSTYDTFAFAARD
jgi:uncharacterized OB-fold protein